MPVAYCSTHTDLERGRWMVESRGRTDLLLFYVTPALIVVLPYGMTFERPSDNHILY